MKENMELINQIAALRKEVTNLNSQLRNQDCKIPLSFNYVYFYSQTPSNLELGTAWVTAKHEWRLGLCSQDDAKSDGL